MDTEIIINQMEQDLEVLALKHDKAADKEYLQALSAPDAESTKVHIENMEHHKLLARMYRGMKDDGLAFVETYDDNADF
jgi:hypothetical protein